MRVNVYLIVLVILAQYCFGQKKTYGKEFSLISQAYANAQNFSSDVIVYSYKEKNQQKGDIQGTGMIRKADKNYYSKFKGEELIANNHCAVIIDSSDREVTYFGEAKGNIGDPFSMAKIDSIMRRQDSVVYAGMKDGLEHYIFYNKNSVMLRVDMYAGATDHFIKRLTYYYAPSDKKNSYDMYKMDIYYNNIRTDKVDNGFFSEKKVLTFKSGKPYLQGKYRSFKLTIADKYQPPTQ
jgi:hypothetical protein